jgi:hypothetical protein
LRRRGVSLLQPVAHCYRRRWCIFHYVHKFLIICHLPYVLMRASWTIFMSFQILSGVHYVLIDLLHVWSDLEKKTLTRHFNRVLIITFRYMFPRSSLAVNWTEN